MNCYEPCDPRQVLSSGSTRSSHAQRHVGQVHSMAKVHSSQRNRKLVTQVAALTSLREPTLRDFHIPLYYTRDK